MKIILIGGGKLGQQLYGACTAAAGIELVQWVVRSAERGKTPEGISLVNEVNLLHHADLYLLAVSDQAIPKVAAALPEKAFVAHTAGGVALEVLNQNHAGVFYPLQTFSEGRNIDFSKLPIGLECKEVNDLPLLEKLVQALGAHAFHMNSKQREQLHLAAVLVNNFTNHLYAEAAALCIQNDLPFELLKPLIQETIDKLENLSPKDAQTGPAVRHDQKTIEKHLTLIQEHSLQEIYKVVTSAIQKKQ
jgi:predicted short-subunit dehydrogenase-like oxidoreductase (DUF2520 family)